MQSFVILLLIIYGANGDNIHKGLDSALQKWGGHLSEKAIKNGVDLDPTFNTSKNSVEYPSHPQCPSPTDGYPWVKYGSPEKCYLAGFQGPCQDNMKMFYNSTSKTGYCDCDCFPNNNTTETFCFKDQPYLKPPYAFSVQTGRCYQLLSQGPCKVDEWFVMDSSGVNSICENRRCHAEQSYETAFYSYNTSSCHLESHVCIMPNNEHDLNISNIPHYYRYQFEEGHWVPQCTLVLLGERGWGGGAISGAILPFDCEMGEIYSKLMQKCIPPYTKSKTIG